MTIGRLVIYICQAGMIDYCTFNRGQSASLCVYYLLTILNQFVMKRYNKKKLVEYGAQHNDLFVMYLSVLTSVCKQVYEFSAIFSYLYYQLKNFCGV